MSKDKVLDHLAICLDKNEKGRKTMDKVLVFMKPDNEIRAFLEQNFECEIHEGNWGDPFPNITWEYIIDWEGNVYNKTVKLEYDWIFSWLCPWKIPKEILKTAKKGAINFHPGPPKYPGIGCYNYAIWNEDKEYGVTSHLMDEQIDHGKMLRVQRFDLLGNETVEMLKNRAIIELKSLFYYTMKCLLHPDYQLNHEVLSLPKNKRGVYKSRKDFQEFCHIKLYFVDEYINALDEEQLERWLRATYFKGARDLPYIEVNGKKWVLTPEEDL